MIASIPSATLLGTRGRPVAVEVHVSNGLPGFTIVGLPDAACRESRDRVRAAMLSSGLPWPTRRVTVNLAPSGVRKGGAGLDLPIAIGLLVATGVAAGHTVEGAAFVGELGLDGSVRHVPGMVALAEAIPPGSLVVAEVDASEAALVGHHTVRGVRTLRQLVAAIRGDEPWPPAASAGSAERTGEARSPSTDLADVRGQALGRRAVEVAAAGGHHLLLVGPPGAGKTMLARRIPGLLPGLSRREALEVCSVYSAAGLLPTGGGLCHVPPFRAPHHAASTVSLVGGGTVAMRPGEISLAHRGVLFLDEMGEFPAAVLDALRQPLEEGVIRVSRARGTASYPARFLLVGAMNPCPCGASGAPGGCRCSAAARSRYARRLSGPILDRFDLRVIVERVGAEALLGTHAGETSAVVRSRVEAARRRARARGVLTNAELCSPDLDRFAPLSRPAIRLLERHLRAGTLSARGLERVRRVARTIADLEGDEELLVDAQVAAALQLRVGPAGR